MKPTIRDLFKARIIVIGDMMIDRYIHGHWSKISGEGVPVFLQSHAEDRPGGAANVGAQFAALGCHWTGFGKEPGQQPWKVRFFDRLTVFRSDLEDCAPLYEASQRAIMASLEASSGYHALVISDYAKGVCVPELCRDAIRWATARGIKVIVDPKGNDWSKYEGADIALPNQAEFDTCKTLDGMRDCSVLVTQGARGMTLLERGGYAPLHIPATNTNPVDVTGCGDTVTAVVAAALAIGADLETAARWANCAAGIVVGKHQTATVTLDELEAAWASQ